MFCFDMFSSWICSVLICFDLIGFFYVFHWDMFSDDMFCMCSTFELTFDVFRRAINSAIPPRSSFPAIPSTSSIRRTRLEVTYGSGQWDFIHAFLKSAKKSKTSGKNKRTSNCKFKLILLNFLWFISINFYSVYSILLLS